MNPVENWTRAYDEAPEIFDEFTRAEDPEGHVVERLLSHADTMGRSILEIGCGTGRYTRELLPGTGSYVALERSPAMLTLARERLADEARRPRFLCAGAERMPFRSGTFDQVMAAWVVLNLKRGKRAVVLSEIDRVLAPRPDCGIWLMENHWTGQFQDLRGRAGTAEGARIRELIDSEGFRLVELVETELRFPSAEAAERVLGYLCGERARRRLKERPAAKLTHNVVILHRPRRR
jgi:ubiquinone/menaquinone biosynthesis C-methylase UbiE